MIFSYRDNYLSAFFPPVLTRATKGGMCCRKMVVFLNHMPSQAPLACDAEQLVSLVLSGDQKALDEITRCFGARMVSAGRKACQNSQDADDAVQDALLAAGTNLSSFRGDGSLEGWLVRMVINACHRMHRGKKNDPHLHGSEEEPTSLDNPETSAAQGEMIERVGKALLALSPADRVILLLAEAEEWTAPEIAKALSLSAVAVRSRLMRARKKVKTVLERQKRAPSQYYPD